MENKDERVDSERQTCRKHNSRYCLEYRPNLEYCYAVRACPTRDVLESPENDGSPEMQASSMLGRRDLEAHAAGARGLLSPDPKWP